MSGVRQELNRRNFLRVAGASAIGMSVAGSVSLGDSTAGAKGKTPNIVYVFTDRWDAHVYDNGMSKGKPKAQAGTAKRPKAAPKKD